ncbi:stAR-related lipid transfer protein 6 isoform X1 [Sciurus carolinensis]|uniref:stAR-related lipid transfer protein 6 isoform X1 n=1 Tax=Sciurus carolinensis TaxID=30640 RepID=UPI001FB30664|nr:stAR-related lipid transfer protein 6 isoform X1 [Sciurus carolinensis]
MDYKAIAQQTAQEVLGYNQDTSGWKVVKISKKITVSSKASRKFLGNLYRVEGIIPESTFKLSDFLYQPGNRVTWDKALKVYNMVHRIDSDTFICHTITQSFAMGSISPRDFIDLVYIKRCEGNMDIISSKSVDFPEYPPSSNYVRGYNHPCGYVCSPLKELRYLSSCQLYVRGCTETWGRCLELGNIKTELKEISTLLTALNVLLSSLKLSSEYYFSFSNNFSEDIIKVLMLI